MRLVGTGILLQPFRETLKAIGQRSELIRAAKVEPEPISYAAQLGRDAAEILSP